MQNILAVVEAVSSFLAMIAAGLAVWISYFVYRRQSEAETRRAEAMSIERNRREQEALDARLKAAQRILAKSVDAVSRANNKFTRKYRGPGFTLGNVMATEDDISESHSLLQSVDVMALPSADLVSRVIEARYWVLTAKRRTAQVRVCLETGDDWGKAIGYEDVLKELKALAAST